MVSERGLEPPLGCKPDQATPTGASEYRIVNEYRAIRDQVSQPVSGLFRRVGVQNGCSRHERTHGHHRRIRSVASRSLPLPPACRLPMLPPVSGGLRLLRVVKRFAG
jgi:hypothetical protein